jgi:thiol-disulfide isomerase/thioredoxin
MSELDVEFNLENKLKLKERVVVLFYASWCPFSRRFLPIFRKYAEDKTRDCMEIMTDDKASLCEKYAIDVVPTILLFDKGKVKKRLDGVPGAGLQERNLESLGD